VADLTITHVQTPQNGWLKWFVAEMTLPQYVVRDWTRVIVRVELVTELELGIGMCSTSGRVMLNYAGKYGEYCDTCQAAVTVNY